MKKNQKGISLILLILIILIILLSYGIYVSLTNKESLVNISYEEHYDENLENEAKRYYYNQLSEPSKIMYDTILNNIDSLKNGNENIKFTSDISESIKNTGGDFENNYFQSTWDALSLDNLEVFYVNTKNLSLSTKSLSLFAYKSYEFTLEPASGKRYYNTSFNSRVDVDNAIIQVEQVANSVSANAKGTIYNKVKYAHDWIVDNLEYDNNNLENNENIYGAFINKKVVCEGYAKAFKYILDKLNIPCVIVYGDGYDNNGKSEAHAWNYVKMTDNKWYAVDTTWDDPIYIGSGKWFKDNSEKYQNFLKGSDNFNKTHINDGDVSGTGQNFKYPELSKTDYKN